MEEWRDIKGYDGIYQVSNRGRVRSLDRIVICKYGQKKLRIKGKILRPGHTVRGYPQVNLSKNNTTKMMLVHRLVAQAFLTNHNNLPCVNHIDGEKTNNRAKNLEWVTHSDNGMHAYKAGLRDKKKDKEHLDRIREKSKKSPMKKVLCVETGEIFRSIRQAAIAKKISNSCISCACSGTQKTAGGYHWMVVG